MQSVYVMVNVFAVHLRMPRTYAARSINGLVCTVSVDALKGMETPLQRTVPIPPKANTDGWYDVCHAMLLSIGLSCMPDPVTL